jgi:hypothetical protein
MPATARPGHRWPAVVVAVLVLVGVVSGWSTSSAAEPVQSVAPAAAPSPATVLQSVGVPGPGGYQPRSPQRLLDTRSGTGGVRQAVPANGSVTVDVTAALGSAAAGSAAINVTVTSPSAAGNVVAYADGRTAPEASTVNFEKGRTAANLAVVPIGADGRIRLLNRSSGTVQLVVDLFGSTVAGAGTAAGSFTAAGPTRLLDTRRSTTARAAAPVAARGSVSIRVAGVGGVPATGAGAVLVNVTAVQPTATGNVAAAAGTSVVNFAPGRTVANLALVQVAADGTITLTNVSAGTVQLVVDLQGWYRSGPATAAGMTTAIDARRLLDTRSGQPVGARQSVSIQVTGGNGRPYPAAGLSAVLVNITAVGATRAGDVTVAGTGLPTPATSNVNFVPGSTVANLVLAAVGKDGTITLTNTSAGSVHLVVDIEGYVQSAVEWTGQPRIGSTGLGQVTGLSCTAGGFCLLAGRNDFAVSTDGATWSATQSYPGFAVDRPVVSCVDASFCAFGGGDGLLRVRTAVGFSTAFAAGGAVDDVSCVSAAFCLAVTHGGTVLTWNGITWSTPVPVDTDQSASGTSSLTCLSTTFCLFADTTGNAWVFDGTDWQDYALSSTSGTVDVACASPVLCLRVDGSDDVVLFANGVWSALPTGLGKHLDRVSCAAAGCWLVTDDLEYLSYVDGRLSGPQPVPIVRGSLGGVGPLLSCAGTDQCVVSAAAGFTALLPSGSAPAPADVAGHLVDVSCPTAAFCATLDAYGQVRMRTGTRWTDAARVDDTGVPVAITCTSASFCLETAGTGRTAAWDGKSWTVVATPPLTAVTSLQCTGPTWCMATGWPSATATAGGTAVFDGTRWSAFQPFATGRGVPAVSCPVAGTCWSYNDERQVQQFGDAGWQVVTGPVDDVDLQAIACGTATSCVALDAAGRAVTLADGSWTGPVAAVSPTLSVPSLTCVAGSTWCVVAQTDTAQSQTELYSTGDGRQWSLDAIDGSPFSDVSLPWSPAAVSCGAVGSCLAVGTFGETWTGAGR